MNALNEKDNIDSCYCVPARHPLVNGLQASLVADDPAGHAFQANTCK